MKWLATAEPIWSVGRKCSWLGYTTMPSHLLFTSTSYIVTAFFNGQPWWLTNDDFKQLPSKKWMRATVSEEMPQSVTGGQLEGWTITFLKISFSTLLAGCNYWFHEAQNNLKITIDIMKSTIKSSQLLTLRIFLIIYTHWWLSARLQYLQNISNGDTVVLHETIDMFNA